MDFNLSLDVASAFFYLGSSHPRDPLWSDPTMLCRVGRRLFLRRTLISCDICIIVMNNADNTNLQHPSSAISRVRAVNTTQWINRIMGSEITVHRVDIYTAITLPKGHTSRRSGHGACCDQWNGSTGQLLPECITPARLGEVVCVRLQGAGIIALKMSFRITGFDFSFYFRKTSRATY